MKSLKPLSAAWSGDCILAELVHLARQWEGKMVKTIEISGVLNNNLENIPRVSSYNTTNFYSLLGGV